MTSHIKVSQLYPKSIPKLYKPNPYFNVKIVSITLLFCFKKLAERLKVLYNPYEMDGTVLEMKQIQRLELLYWLPVRSPRLAFSSAMLSLLRSGCHVIKKMPSSFCGAQVQITYYKTMHLYSSLYSFPLHKGFLKSCKMTRILYPVLLFFITFIFCPMVRAAYNWQQWTITL